MYANTISTTTTARNKVLSQAFIMVGAMMATMGAVAFATKSIHFSPWVYIGLLVSSFIMLFVIEANKNNMFGLIGLMIFSVLDGICFGPMLQKYLNLPNGSEIITLATLTTAAIATGCSIYAIKTKKDFSFMFGFLFIATIGIIVAMILNIFLNLAILSFAISVFGIFVFSAWMLFDVSRIVNGGETNYVSAALGIFLNIKNLLNFVLQFLGMDFGKD